MAGSTGRLAALGAALILAAIGGCGGGGSSGNSGGGTVGCVDCAPLVQNFLTEAEVQRVIAQAVGEARARNVRANIAVVDRVGNVLAVFKMTGAPATITISSGVVNAQGLPTRGGLDGIPSGIVPATLSSIAKAISGAYLSSSGNAFTTRTASQIIQEHFLPHESQQPSGPLYGVQFSQLTCSDVTQRMEVGTGGPQRSPLGLSADPGGMPIYKNGTVVGGIGVEADGLYSLDRNIQDNDYSPEELVAVAGVTGFEAPVDRRADRITAGGVTLRYVDSDGLVSNPAQAAPFASLDGALVAEPGYNNGVVRRGVAYGTAASGIRVATNGMLGALRAFVLVRNDDVERFPPVPSADGLLSAAEVEVIISEAVKVARRARAQIRRPLGSAAEVTMTVVGLNGDILALALTGDQPLFGVDVSAQKARGALLFSLPNAGTLIQALPPAGYITSGPSVYQESSPGSYISAARSFFGDPALFTGQHAWSMRAIGNIHRPFYPDGLDTSPNGPLSTPYSNWSPFNVGFQLDLVYNQLIKAILGDTSLGCAGRAGALAPMGTPDGGLPIARNGVQIFPGGVPIYRGGQLVGALGISGDGVDQDDMIAFLGLHNASQILNSGIGHAPMERRADVLTPQGVRLRYVQCPQAPFNNSDEQNVCAGK